MQKREVAVHHHCRSVTADTGPATGCACRLRLQRIPDAGTLPARVDLVLGCAHCQPSGFPDCPRWTRRNRHQRQIMAGYRQRPAAISPGGLSVHRVTAETLEGPRSTPGDYRGGCIQSLVSSAGEARQVSSPSATAPGPKFWLAGQA